MRLEAFLEEGYHVIWSKTKWLYFKGLFDQGIEFVVEGEHNVLPG